MLRIIRWAAILVGVVLLTIFAVRAYDSQTGAPLGLWQTFVPDELSADALDTADWTAYLAAEDRALAEVRAEVSDKLPAADCTLANRYCPLSPLYTPKFKQDWNRSFVLEPVGPPKGAVVLLHGLTDSPYSVRHLAEQYRAAGWLALAIRLPGHGTVPAGLTRVTTDQWRAATRLAAREAVRRVGPGRPLHLVGYSNGAALALDYALSALADPALKAPARLVLLSPEVGITAFARFAGLAGLPALFPAFAKAAWLDLLPEYNPFKYNSFAVNAARQSFAMTQIVQRAIRARAADGSLAKMPPVLSFTSLIDSTVDMRATVTALYNQLPQNGSELVVFDVNRDAVFASLLKPGSVPVLDRLTVAPPRRYALSVVSNVGSGAEVEARETPAGSRETAVRPLGLAWPRQVYSLGHVALPFPDSDGLYGLTPDPADFFGIRLGTVAARGERGVLVVSADMMLRISSNPFYPVIVEKIAAGL